MVLIFLALTSEVLKFSIKHSFEFVDLNEEVDPEGNSMELPQMFPIVTSQIFLQ